MNDKILTYIATNPSVQYSFYRMYGVIKQLGSVFHEESLGCDNNKLIFIVGSGRSGNTLLRRLLMENFDIYIPPETYVLGSTVKSMLMNSSLKWDEKVDIVLGKLECHPEFYTFEIASLTEFALQAKGWGVKESTIGNLYFELYHWISSKKNISTSWIGDKTPLNTLNLGLIKKLFPEAHYLYIERDGVDVSSSYIEAGIYDNIEVAAERWINSKKAWRKFKPMIASNKYLEVSYENLVTDYVSVIEEIGEKFRIPTRSINGETIGLMGDVNMHKHHSSVSKPPNKSSIGKGRINIHKNDKNKLKNILNPELIKSGYKAL